MAPSISPLSTLPPELALKIISLASEGSGTALCQLRVVSREFRELVSQVDSVLWTLPCSGVMETEVLAFLRSARKITSLGLVLCEDRWSRPVPPSVGFLTGAFMLTPYLQKLRLYGINFKRAYEHSGRLVKQLFQSISQFCPHVCKLEVSLHGACLDEGLPENGLFPALKALRLRMLSPDCEISKTFFESLINHCPILEAVELSGAADHIPAHLRSTSLRSLRIQEDKAWFAKLEAPNLAHLQLDLFIDTVIDAPNLRTLVLGKPSQASEGSLRSSSLWRLQYLEIMGHWPVSHVMSVLGACQELAALSLERLQITELQEHTSLCTHPFVQCVLERLGCVQALMVNSSKTFGQVRGRCCAEAPSAWPLTSLRCLSVFYSRDADTDINICMDLIASSPNVEHFEMLIEEGQDFRPVLSLFLEQLARERPCLQVRIEQNCRIWLVGYKWQLEKTGLPPYLSTLAIDF